MVQRKRAMYFWRTVIVIFILAVLGGLAFAVSQISAGAWSLFATQTPTPTFTPTPVLPTATLVVPTETPSATPTPERGEPITYTVVSGDTLIGIGESYGVDVETLIAYNGLTNPNLFVGQQILIPPSSFVYDPPTVTPVPTDLKPGTYITYTIKVGDSLGAIAEEFNSRVTDIVVANPDELPDPNNIPIGVTIRIPYNSILLTPTRTPIPTNTRRP